MIPPLAHLGQVGVMLMSPAHRVSERIEVPRRHRNPVEIRTDKLNSGAARFSADHRQPRRRCLRDDHSPGLEAARQDERAVGRTWSAEQKAAIVAESIGGSESVSAVARQHGLTATQLLTWRRQMRGRSVMAKERLSFASVVVNSAAIEIEYGGATIRVPTGSDAATVRAVLQAVKAMA